MNELLNTTYPVPDYNIQAIFEARANSVMEDGDD